MSDIVERLTYALGNRHWGRSGILEEARAEILRLRRENATLYLQVPTSQPDYRGKHLLRDAEEMYRTLSEAEAG
jgi:hypothetical protein